MNECLDGLRDNICTPYLDILVHSNTLDEYGQDFLQILRRLQEHAWDKVKAIKVQDFPTTS